MLRLRRLLPLLGAAAGGLLAAAVVPMAVAYADDCALGDCTLVSGGSPTDVVYQGFRPFLTDWQQNQPVNVEVPGSSFANDISGSYVVSEQDFQSPLMDNAIYKYGDFTSAATNPSGIDSDGLSGASVYDFTYGPGANGAYLLNNLNVLYSDGAHTEVTTVPGEFTNYLVASPAASGDWIELAGQSTPIMLWDSLNSSAFPATYIADLLQNVIPPDLWSAVPGLASSLLP